MNFMIVDDTATMRKIIGLALKGLGHKFIEAENGKDALEKLSGENIDRFIIDINMPVMNGIELIQELRKKSEYSSTPILVVTTEHEKEMIEKGKSLGASDWLIKPFQKEDLVKKIS